MKLIFTVMYTFLSTAGLSQKILIMKIYGKSVQIIIAPGKILWAKLKSYKGL